MDKRKIYDLVNIFSTLGLIQRVVKGHYQWKSLKYFVSTIEKVPVFDQLDIKHKTDKSLGSMAYCFLSLLKTYSVLSLDDTAEQLSTFNDINFKSKIRRLYDICKIFTVLGLIVQLPDVKRPVFRWQDTQSLETDVAKILTSENPKTYNDKNNVKLNQLKTEFFNNVSKAIENSDLFKCSDMEVLRKRRTSSFDISIVEEFLMNSNPVVLPKVSIQAPEKRFYKFV